jgi:hypothetical protein
MAADAIDGDLQARPGAPVVVMLPWTAGTKIRRSIP